MLVATIAMTLKTGFVEPRVNTCLSRKACESADSEALWMVEKLLELPSRRTKTSSLTSAARPIFGKATTPAAAGGRVYRSRGGRAYIDTVRRRVSASAEGPARRYRRCRRTYCPVRCGGERAENTSCDAAIELGWKRSMVAPPPNRPLSFA